MPECWITFGIRNEPSLHLTLIAILGVAESRRAGQMNGIRRSAQCGVSRHETFLLSDERLPLAVDDWLSLEGVPLEVRPQMLRELGRAIAAYLPPTP